MKRNRHLSSIRAKAVTAACICALSGSPVLAGGISAGSLIQNTATATYEEGGKPKTVTSNTVTVRVDELLDVTVTSLDSGPISVGPGEAILTYEVTNQGNGPEAFELFANPAIGGNDFDASVTSIAIDSNGNGVYDPGVDEVLSSPETTPVLAADEAITVFVILTVPDDASDGQLSDVELTASAATGNGTAGTVFEGQGEGGGDAIVGTTTASASAIGSLSVSVTSLNLTKAASLVDPFGGGGAVPGSVVTFTLTANVFGSGSIDNIVITDPIPEGTTYSAGSLRLDTAPLTDATDEDAGEGSNENGISVDLGTVSAGTTHTVTFDVTID